VRHPDQLLIQSEVDGWGTALQLFCQLIQLHTTIRWIVSLPPLMIAQVPLPRAMLHGIRTGTEEILMAHKGASR
jgi:hypothetical protein